MIDCSRNAPWKLGARGSADLNNNLTLVRLAPESMQEFAQAANPGAKLIWENEAENHSGQLPQDFAVFQVPSAGGKVVLPPPIWLNNSRASRTQRW